MKPPRHRALPSVALLAWVTGCTTPQVMPASRIEQILRADPRLAAPLADAERLRLEARLGVITAAPDGSPRIEWSDFRRDAEYFYPASSVKLLAAVAGFERLNELARETGLAIDDTTAMAFAPQFGEDGAETDPTNLEGGTIILAHEIRKLFLVSDNEAFNRLYELLGQDGLARFAERHGLASTRLVHRLSEGRSARENLLSPRIELRGADFVHVLPERRPEPLPPAPPRAGTEIGAAYLAGGEKVERPMDFRGKNRVSLADLSAALVPLVRPDLAPDGPRYDLTERQRDLLREALSQLPRESENPRYDPAEYPDHYVKLLLPGAARVVPAAELRIYNKTGRAYGFTIENAYVEHVPTGRGFFLSAVLYTNANGVLNDDAYEYETVADPFFADLGEAVARTVWGE